MTEPSRVLSGMQPSGDLHIGNYLGALREWARISSDPNYQALFCIVDAHAITVEYEPSELRSRVIEAVATYVAGGIDPDRSIVFLQSDVPAHMELAWYFNCITPMGELSRMTQFKDKGAQQKNVMAGLFTYPILMAADILIYKAKFVPVGEDQVQHLELAREICRKFNARFGNVFPEPQPRLSTTPRIMGLDGKAKMSKSLGNAVAILDSKEVVEKKLRGAFTDPEKLRLGDPGRPEICNVFTMHKGFSPAEMVREVETNCRSGALACGNCKKMLCGTMESELGPVRERALSLRSDKPRVLSILRNGAERARAIADTTMAEVRDAMGLTTARQ